MGRLRVPHWHLASSVCYHCHPQCRPSRPPIPSSLDFSLGRTKSSRMGCSDRAPTLADTCVAAACPWDPPPVGGHASAFRVVDAQRGHLTGSRIGSQTSSAPREREWYRARTERSGGAVGSWIDPRRRNLGRVSSTRSLAVGTPPTQRPAAPLTPRRRRLGLGMRGTSAQGSRLAAHLVASALVSLPFPQPLLVVSHSGTGTCRLWEREVDVQRATATSLLFTICLLLKTRSRLNSQ